MTHEPDVLEACDVLHVRVTAALRGDPQLPPCRAGTQPRRAGTHGCPSTTAAGSVDDPVVVDCHFAHEKIFDHYQQINRGFWQHENLPTLPVRKKGIPLPALLA